MIDMITQIELEDSIKVKARVDSRVKEVALLIARINGDLNPEEGKEWVLKRYHIDMNDYEGDRKHLNNSTVNATLSCPWNKRPPTQKFGVPEDDDHDYEDEFYEDRKLSRMIQFPRRYLITSDATWIDEVKAECIRRKKWWANYNKKGVENAIETTKKSLERLIKELEKINKILEEK